MNELFRRSVTSDREKSKSTLVKDILVVLLTFLAVTNTYTREWLGELRKPIMHMFAHEFAHFARALYYFVFELLVPYSIVFAVVAYIIVRLERRELFTLEKLVEKPVRAFGRGVYIAIRLVFFIWITLVLTGAITSIATHKLGVHLLAMLVMLAGWTLASAVIIYTIFGWILPRAINHFGFWQGSAIAVGLFAIIENVGDVTVLSVMNAVLLGVLLLIFGLRRNEIFSLVGILTGWHFALIHVFGFHYGGTTYRAGKFVFATANEALWSGGYIGAAGGLLATLALSATIGWHYWKMRTHN